MSAEAPQLIYFVSGMWCSTCAKNIRESVSQMEGVDSADLNYASKLLLVRPKSALNEALLDQSIQAKVARIGFGIKKQSEGWVLNFHKSLQKEADRKISWTLISSVWFLAMWSSMLAFAGYIDGGLSAEEHYYLALASSVFGLPAILLGIIPFGKAGGRALWFSRLLTLDLFIFFGGLSAFSISMFSIFSHSSATYADSGSMVIAILLLTKKIENTIVTSITSNILFQLHPKKKTVEVFRKSEWVAAEVSQIKKGSLVRVSSGETIPFDGVIQSEHAEINNHLMSGEPHPIQLKKGDHVFAGAIAHGVLEIQVTAAQGERKIDGWAETALLSESGKSKYTQFFSKVESGLVIFAFSGALLASVLQALRGAETSLVIESFFVGILVFCPCLFASIIPLMTQMVHLALLQRGILLSRTDALLDLSSVKNFYFDKTGTLEALDSQFIPTSEDDHSAAPYLKALAEQSQHAILRGLKIHGEIKTIREFKEHPGQGLEAEASDGTKILIGRSSFLKAMGVRIPTTSLLPFVSLNGVVAGQISIKSLYDESSRHFLKKLLSLVPRSKIQILSGDPAPEAEARFAGIDQKISYLGNLSPEGKAQEIKGASLFVGDGLNDTLALAKARVSFRLGHRVLGFAPVDFHLQTPNLHLILVAIQYSKKYRKVLIQTAFAALTYNISALTLAALGKFSPLGAVLSMLVSFSVMLLSIFRLNHVEEVKE